MNWLFYTLLCAFAFFVIGFSLAYNPYDMSQSEVDNIVNQITYTKDERSGLCYAMTYHRLACVPCEAVEKLIKKEGE